MYFLNYFNHEIKADNYFLANDIGNYIVLPEDVFFKFIKIDLSKVDDFYERLLELGFLYESKVKFLEKFTPILKNKKTYLFERTQLHIFVLTNKCNLECIYCQAKSSSVKKSMMSRDDAIKFVDLALSSESNSLNFEFQGGEPTLNFDLIKIIINYSEINKKNKEINYNLVTNLYDITEEQIKFLIKNNVNICTSLDGDEIIHNRNRKALKNDSFKKMKNNILFIQNEYKNQNLDIKIQAIQTTSKYSLNSYKKIINTFLEQGLKSIFLRPLSPLGKSNDSWKNVGYSPEEYLIFYKHALNYILELNKNGLRFIEHSTLIFLKRIFENEKLNYMEMRSPCGAGIGQIAYNYDGKVYTCDEGRMLKEDNDESFLVGSANTSFNDIYKNKVTESVLAASLLEAIPGCSECVYSQYCGVCPVYNYIEQKSIFSNPHLNYRCKINKGIFDEIFKILSKNNEDSKVLLDWLK